MYDRIMTSIEHEHLQIVNRNVAIFIFHLNCFSESIVKGLLGSELSL
jgi:metal-responsive CopG/Arc/MetJ family transcriptional regulator